MAAPNDKALLDAFRAVTKPAGTSQSACEFNTTAQQNADEINQIIRLEVIYPLAPPVQKTTIECKPAATSGWADPCDYDDWFVQLFGCTDPPADEPIECVATTTLVPDPRYPPAVRVRFGTDAQGPILLDPGDPPKSWPTGQIFEESRYFLLAFLALVCHNDVKVEDASFDEYDGAKKMLTRPQMRCVWARRLAVSAYQDIYRLPWRIRDLSKPDFELLFAWNPRPCRNSRKIQPVFLLQPATTSQAMYAKGLPPTPTQDADWGIDLQAEDAGGAAGGSQYLWFWQNPPPLPAVKTDEDDLSQTVWPPYPDEDAEIYHFYAVWDPNPFANFLESVEAEVVWARMRKGMGLPFVSMPKDWTMVDGFEAAMLMAMSQPFLVPDKSYDGKSFEAQLGDAWRNVEPADSAPPLDFGLGPVPTFERIGAAWVRFGGSPLIGQYVQALLRVMNIPARLFPARTPIVRPFQCVDEVVSLNNGLSVPQSVKLAARDASPTVTSAPDPTNDPHGGVAQRYMLCVPPLDLVVNADDLHGQSGLRYVARQRDLCLPVANSVARWTAAGAKNWSYLASPAGQVGERLKAAAAVVGLSVNGVNEDNFALNQIAAPTGVGGAQQQFHLVPYTRAAFLAWAKSHKQRMSEALAKSGDLYVQARLVDSRRKFYLLWRRTLPPVDGVRPVHFHPQNFSLGAIVAFGAGGGKGWPVDQVGEAELPSLVVPSSQPQSWLDQDYVPMWQFIGTAIDVFADRVVDVP